MSLRPRSPDELQRRAADPEASAWVAASAGSGKTTVLTNRVLRLLLAGRRPTSLLCLTFTRAAAAEMGNRLAKRLARWASTDDVTLHAELSHLFGVEPKRGDDAAGAAIVRRGAGRAGRVGDRDDSRLLPIAAATFPPWKPRCRPTSR